MKCPIICETECNSMSFANIMITTPIYYSLIADGLATTNKKIDRVIIDEIDSVTSILSKPLSTKMLWLVSASFKNDARLTKLGINMTNIESVKCNCENVFIKECFPIEEPKYTKIICKNIYLDVILTGMLNSDEFNEINALNYTNIKTNFIKKIATSDAELIEIIVHDIKATIEHDNKKIADLNDSIHKLKNAIEFDIECEVHEEIDDCNYNKCIVNEDLLQKTKYNMKNQQNKLDCLVERLQNTNTCLICYDEIEGHKCITECCKNAFCEKCILMWANTRKTCPYCRASNLNMLSVKEPIIVVQPILEVMSETLPDVISEVIPQQKTKLEIIKNLIEDNNLGQSIIIFSDYSNIFKEISKIFIEKNIKYVELDGGNITAIDRDMQLFKSRKARVLMTNSSLYGCGMNLENATDVIFLHKTEKTMYEQVIGRAQRPGRTCQLHVTELLHENENENASTANAIV